MASFLSLMNPAIVSLRICGLFPFCKTTLHIGNAWSFAVLAFLLCSDIYSMTVKTFDSVNKLMTHFVFNEAILFSIWIWFYAGFACVLVIAWFGFSKKLEKFDELLTIASKQRGIKTFYKQLRRKFITFAVIFGSFFLIMSTCYPGLLMFDDFTNSWSTAKVVRDAHGNTVFAHLFTVILVLYNSFALSCSSCLYVMCCECLKMEFHHLNTNIKQCNMSDIALVKKIALNQANLFVCLSYLNGMISFYATALLTCSTLITVLYGYTVILEGEVIFRVFSFSYILVGFSENALICCLADGLYNEAIASKEYILLKIAQENVNFNLDDNVFQTASIIAQQSTTEIGLTALGFFKLSKGALLTTYSFVITYVIILLQSPSASSGIQLSNNATNFN